MPSLASLNLLCRCAFLFGAAAVHRRARVGPHPARLRLEDRALPGLAAPEARAARECAARPLRTGDDGQSKGSTVSGPRRAPASAGHHGAGPPRCDSLLRLCASPPDTTISASSQFLEARPLAGPGRTGLSPAGHLRPALRQCASLGLNGSVSSARSRAAVAVRSTVRGARLRRAAGPARPLAQRGVA